MLRQITAQKRWIDKDSCSFYSAINLPNTAPAVLECCPISFVIFRNCTKCFVIDLGFFLFQGKQRAAVKWLLSKAFNNKVPENCKEPFYRNHEVSFFDSQSFDTWLDFFSINLKSNGNLEYSVCIFVIEWSKMLNGIES